MKDPKKVSAGKRSHAQGREFEKRVRKDLEAKGWIVDKWTNNVDIENDKLKQVKPMWIKGRVVMISGGFPDFVCWRNDMPELRIVGVESKMTGELDKGELDKCRWLLKNKIFNKIAIAEKTKVKNKIQIIYRDFGYKHGE